MNRRYLALPLAATLLLPAAAQQTNQNQQSQSGNAQIQTGISDNANTNQQNQNGQATDKPRETATGKPLEGPAREGFWGRVNPFARKKYIQRQMEPMRNRVNELDELTAGNSKQIKDVDARATEGIKMASNRANEADQKAAAAGTRANEAYSSAQQATQRLQTVEQTVSKLDQYQPLTETEIRFKPGQKVLSKNAKSALDQLAQPLKDQRGYVVEVQGFASGTGQGAIQNSQKMADAVVRYLVLEHEVPVHKVYVVGMGNAPAKNEDGTKARRTAGGRVVITLLQNGLGTMQASNNQQQGQTSQQQ